MSIEINNSNPVRAFTPIRVFSCNLIIILTI